MTADERIRPPLLRWTDRFGWSPWFTGLVVLAFSLGIVAITAVVGGDFGVEGSEATQDLRVAIILAMLLAFVPAAQCFIDSRARRTFEELRPRFEPDPVGLAEWQHRIERVNPRAHRRTILASVAVLFSLAFLPEAIAMASFGLDQIGGLSLLHRILLPLVGVASGSLLTSTVSSSLDLSQACRTQGRVHLFETKRWRPLAQLGLANAFVLAGIISLVLLLIPDRDAGVGLALFLAGVVLALAVLAMVSVLLPIWGLRQRVQAEKQTQRDAYQRELEELLNEPQSAPGRLADLVAYGRLLEDADEWPLDLPQIGRLSLLLGLPLGSWIASALVERLLDGFLG